MRLARLSFALYLALLLVWFVPAHTRGELAYGREESRVAGEPVAPGGHGCCASRSIGSEQPAPQREPTEQDRENCLVCHFALALSLTAPVAFVAAPLGSVATLAPATPVRVVPAWLQFPRQSRGPPVGIAS